MSLQLALSSDDLLLGLIYTLAFAGSVTAVLVTVMLFSVGWESYEEKYIQGAERTLDDLFLTIPPQQLLWLSVLAGFALFVVGFVLSGTLLGGLPLALVGGLIPRLALKVMRKRRVKKFGDQLVEALITLTNALRSGFSLPKAFQLIAQDMPKPICQEFGILVQELRLGSEAEEGLKHMLERVPSQDLDLLTTSIAISASVGGNLAEVFDRIADTIRERHRIEGRIDALTAQGKMQGIMVSILPIVVGVAINFIDPTMMAPLFSTGIGLALLGVMVLMEGLGYFFVSKVTNIEV